MLKAEFIQSLKQTNVSADGAKTMERVKELWRTLEKAKRDEILKLSGVKKPSIERAYKSGNISAKIIAAMSLVLKVDPDYLAGISDTYRTYDEKLVTQFLTKLGYEVGKGDAVKQRKKREAAPQPNAAEASAPSTANTGSGLNDLVAISAEISKLLDKEAQTKVSGLSEEDLVLMLKSLSVQAQFSVFRKSRLELIKYLLLF